MDLFIDVTAISGFREQCVAGLSMRLARSRMSAQLHAQLGSCARHVARTSFIKDAHPSSKESSHN